MRGDEERAAAAGLRKKQRKEAPTKALEIIPFEKMLAPNLETRSIVKGLLAPAVIALIFGESGCGKTFFTLDLALHIAGGIKWFERRVARGRVVYVATEAGRSIHNRVAAFAQQNCGDQSEFDFAAVVSPVDLCHLGDGDDVDRLIAVIEKADVVIIDTVSRALAGGNENAPDDMGAFVNALDRIRAALGCTVVAVHHVGKDPSRGGRGHSLLHCAVDTEIEVVRREGGVCVATVLKQRDGPGGGEIAFTLAPIELGLDQDGDPVTSCVVRPSDWVPEAKSKEATGQAAMALMVLSQALAEHGAPRTFGDVQRRAVRVDVWRDHLAKSALFGTGSKFRNAWARAHNRLLLDGHVGFADGFVWAAKPEEPM